MLLSTNNGIIDTKDVEYIKIEQQLGENRFYPEFLLIARVNGKDYKIENTKDIDELKVCSKYKSLVLALLQEEPQIFISAPLFHLVNVRIAKNCILENKNKGKMYIMLSNGQNLVKKFSLKNCQPALESRVLEERLR